MIVAIAEDRDPVVSRIKSGVGGSMLITRITRRSQQRLGISVGKSVWLQVKSVALVR